MNSMPPILFRDPTPGVLQAPPLIPPPASGPDFDELANLLNNFLSPPDNAGEIVINAEEARQLRRLGWSARAGVWRAPLLPRAAIARYRVLWLLDDSIDPHSRPVAWRFPRAAFIRPQISPDYLSKRERQVLRLLTRNGRLSRTQLQQRVSYLIPTSILDFLLCRLQTQQLITIIDGWIYSLETRRTTSGL